MSDQVRVFVSHNHEDNDYCRQYVAGLRARGCVVWYDEHNLGWGAIRPNIEAEMQQSQHFVAILSPASVASQWVNAEIDAAIDLVHVQKLRSILFVVAARCEVPLLLRRWKRLEGPGEAPMSVAEAVAKSVDIMGVPSSAPTAEPPGRLLASPSREEIPSPRALITPARPKAVSRPPRFSRRKVLIGSGVAAGVVVIGGGATLLVIRSLSIHLPYDLASRGFVLRTQGITRYIVPPLATVPSGDFLMGSDPKKDLNALPAEQPQQRLRLGAFQIAKYSVTVAEYVAFVAQSGHSAPPDNPSPDWYYQQQDLEAAVVNVNWSDARAYATWLAQLTGEPWRLATEAEWEKAARGTDGRIYPWGDQWDAQARTEGYDASPYGVQDMVNDVYQWTSTLYRPYPYSRSDGREDVNSFDLRVLRGGPRDNDPQSARAAYRFAGDPLVVSNSYGFRLVRAAAGSG
jgi:formylglycine-generating enzyme required for sulfatase activity